MVRRPLDDHLVSRFGVGFYPCILRELLEHVTNVIFRVKAPLLDRPDGGNVVDTVTEIDLRDEFPEFLRLATTDKWDRRDWTNGSVSCGGFGVKLLQVPQKYSFSVPHFSSLPVHLRASCRVLPLPPPPPPPLHLPPLLLPSPRPPGLLPPSHRRTNLRPCSVMTPWSSRSSLRREGF